MNHFAPLIKEKFVAVTVNRLTNEDCKCDGDNGSFSADLGTAGNGFQITTAEGKLLGTFYISGVNGVGYKDFEDAIKKWDALPEADRKPKTLKLDDAQRSVEVQPPPGGLIIRVYTRNLKYDPNKKPARITPADVQDKKAFPDEPWRWANAIFTQPMPDILWLTEPEWKSLVPVSPKKGDSYEIPVAIRRRIFRYYLLNSTFGLTFAWPVKDIRSEKLTLTVEEVSPVVRLRLDGATFLSDNPELDKATHGFDAKLAGCLVYDPKVGAFTRFDFVAVGDSRGGDYEGNRLARPGHPPLGVAFELAKGRSAAELVPPKGVGFKEGFRREYFAAEK